MPIDQTNQRLMQSLMPQDPGTGAATPMPPTDPVLPADPVPPADPQPTTAQPPAQTDDLVLLEKLLAEAEQTVPQAVPTAMLQTVADATQAQNPGSGKGGKETIGAGAQNVVEAGASTQYVEYEPSPELPPEVEGYLNKTEQHANQAPTEVVIADTSTPLPNDRQLPSQPVVVLPITPEIEKQGMTKTPQFSIRWLVEWSHKIMKMFVGKVIYFQK